MKRFALCLLVLACYSFAAHGKPDRGPRPKGPAVWKTIQLGNGINARDFQKALEAKEIYVAKNAGNVLNGAQFSVAQKPTTVDLVVVSVVGLGLDPGATLEEIYTAAKGKGFELCPDEVGPQLRLQYLDQPKDEWLTIGMEPVVTFKDARKFIQLFSIEHPRRGLWFEAAYHFDDYRWDGEDLFVFVLPRK